MRLDGLVFWIACTCTVVIGCGKDPASEGDGGTTMMMVGTTGEPPTPSPTDPSDPNVDGSSSGEPADTSGSTTDAAESSSSSSTGEPLTTESSSSDDACASSCEESTSTGDEPNAACIAGCEVELECSDEWPDLDACVAWCEANLDKAAAFSPFCREAWENLHECLGTLTCEGFAEWEAAAMLGYPCWQQDNALMFECEGQ